MLTIGFANQFYTLWDVTKETRYTAGEVLNGVFTGQSYEVTKLTYYKNLSVVYEEAIAKIEQLVQGGEYEINLELKGQSREYSSGKKFDAKKPEPWQFPYGKLMWEDIRTCDDVWQLERIYNEGSARNKVYARRRLIELGELVAYAWEQKVYDFENSTDDNYVFNLVQRKYATKRQAQRFEEEKNKANKSGFFFSEGEKVLLSVKEIARFSFETQYGYTTILTMETEQGQYVYYKGGTPPSLNEEGYTNIQGTVKYNEYKGLQQTLLQRIKIK